MGKLKGKERTKDNTKEKKEEKQNQNNKEREGEGKSERGEKYHLCVVDNREGLSDKVGSGWEEHLGWMLSGRRVAGVWVGSTGVIPTSFSKGSDDGL